MRDTVYPPEFEEMLKHLTLMPNGDIVTAEGKVVGHTDLYDDIYSGTTYAISIKGDTISRSALLETVDKEREYLKARGLLGAEHILTHNFRNLVEDAPTVNDVVLSTDCNTPCLCPKCNKPMKPMKTMDNPDSTVYVCFDCGYSTRRIDDADSN